MPLPTQLGQPCWEVAQVAKVISVNAQVNTQSVDYFLAAHSPFRYITNFRNPGNELNEEAVFEDIFSEGRGEVLAGVKGEPGTGKSHLVHWLKLRTDFAVQSGEKGFGNVVRVLVERKNGSLKDALSQIVEQLGSDFEDQLARVKGAIEKLSAETARATLLAKLALEVGYHWQERGRVLPNSLRHLGQALQSKGVGRWLMRKGGTIDRVIGRLTEVSTVEERETFPLFEAVDLEPKTQFLSADENAQQVRAFFDDMEMEPEVREEALKVLNTALRDAVRELTGLSGSTLQDVFIEIRRKLGKKKVLTLFIEDVSVTGLDRDVLTALEPQSRNDLCRLVAVVGITSNAFGRLEQAQRDRVTPAFEIGAEMTLRWSGDEEEVAKFTARYLNAVRFNDKEIKNLAKSRFGRDVPSSKCTDCGVRVDCHKIFGSVKLADDVEIGMFPFTKRAPQALLSKLKVGADTTGVARSQRGLLENVLGPILRDSRTALEEKEFPRIAAIPLHAVPMPSWESLENSYLGGALWDEGNKRRLRMLADFWVTPGTADQLAAELAPLIKPFRFPPFAKAPKKLEPKAGQTEKKSDSPPPPPEANATLTKLLTSLQEWSRGSQLQRDTQFRELLSDMISRSILWEDERSVPYIPQEFKLRVANAAFPKIQGQTANPANQPYFLDLPRGEETRSVLSALAQFKHRGGSSWNFPSGELHKRTISRWLRKNRARTVATTIPASPLDRLDAVHAAAKVLALAAMIRDRKSLTDEPVECIRRMFAPLWDEQTKPVILSQEMRELVSDLEKRHSSLREIVLREVGAGQGRVEAKDFVDPQPLLTAVDSLQTELKIDPLPPGFNEGAWKARFYHAANLAVYSDLAPRLAAERKRIGEKAAESLAVIRKGGCDEKDPQVALKEWLHQFIEVIELQRGGKGKSPILPHPNEAFDELWSQGGFRKRGDVWATALSSGMKLEKVAPHDVLTFNPATLADLATSLNIADRHLKEVDAVLTGLEKELEGKGGGNRDALLAELAAFPLAESSASNAGSEANE